MNPTFATTQALLFDYGGTLDTNSIHWSEVIYNAYQQADLSIPKQIYREAYVHAERTLATQPLILPHHTMLQLLQIKIHHQLHHINNQLNIFKNNDQITSLANTIAAHCDNYARKTTAQSRQTLLPLSKKYPLAIVSNFYGNLHTVLQDYNLIDLFQTVVESAVVNIRKPDPQIFALAAQQLHISPSHTTAIGDSYTKDILPAHQAQCLTIWFKGTPWQPSDNNPQNDISTATITTLQQLHDHLL